MKKSIMVIALVLVLAVSGSVFAAGIKFDGSLKSNLEWYRDLEGNIETRPSSELRLNFGLDTANEKTRAVVEFGIGDKNSNGLDLELDPSNLSLKKLISKPTAHSGTAGLKQQPASAAWISTTAHSV